MASSGQNQQQNLSRSEQAQVKHEEFHQKLKSVFDENRAKLGPQNSEKPSDKILDGWQQNFVVHSEAKESQSKGKGDDKG